MRAASRLLASVKSGRFLEAGTPTGLTGLRTHPSPRWALMYTYTLTLNRLKTLPETSVYRQSTEALTKHRLKILEEVKPEGWDAWKEQQDASMKAKADALKAEEKQREPGREVSRGVKLEPKMIKDKDGKMKPEERKDGPKDASSDASRAASKEAYQKKINELEATAGAERQAKQSEMSREERVHHEMAQADQEFGPLPEITEPPLSAEQISELEQKLGAGLIEEVLQVAEGELDLVRVMAQNAVWEELVEKPAEGQWLYFERQGQHVKATQKP